MMRHYVDENDEELRHSPSREQAMPVPAGPAWASCFSDRIWRFMTILDKSELARRTPQNKKAISAYHLWLSEYTKQGLNV